MQLLSKLQEAEQPNRDSFLALTVLLYVMFKLHPAVAVLLGDPSVHIKPENVLLITFLQPLWLLPHYTPDACIQSEVWRAEGTLITGGVYSPEQWAVLLLADRTHVGCCALVVLSAEC